MRIVDGRGSFLLSLIVAATATATATDARDTSTEYVPVVIWDNVKEEIATPSLKVVSTDGLTRILERKIEASPELSLLVFAEEGLTVEEMTYRAREAGGGTGTGAEAGAFGELATELAAHDKLNMTFLLRVEKAVVAVSRLDVPTTMVSSEEEGEPARPGEMLIVRFAGRPRNREALKEHVSRMRELYRKWRHSTVPGAPKLVLVTSRRSVSPPTADGFYGEEKVPRASPAARSGPLYWKNNFVYVYLTSDPVVARVGKAVKLEECPTAGGPATGTKELGKDEEERGVASLAREEEDGGADEDVEEDDGEGEGFEEDEEEADEEGDEGPAGSRFGETARSSAIEKLTGRPIPETTKTTSYVPSVDPIVRPPKPTEKRRRRRRRGRRRRRLRRGAAPDAASANRSPSPSPSPSPRPSPSSPPPPPPNGTHTFTMCSGGKETVRLYIRPEGAFWTIPIIEVYLDGKTYTIRSDIGAPQSFSYHCDRWSAADEKKTVNLSLPGLQIQPYFERSIGKIFGPAYDCVGLTSPAIWTGLLLVWFEGAVFAYGIYMMTSLRTNDLFDKPNGPVLAPPSNVN